MVYGAGFGYGPGGYGWSGVGYGCGYYGGYGGYGMYGGYGYMPGPYLSGYGYGAGRAYQNGYYEGAVDSRMTGGRYGSRSMLPASTSEPIGSLADRIKAELGMPESTSIPEAVNA